MSKVMVITEVENGYIVEKKDENETVNVHKQRTSLETEIENFFTVGT